MDKGEVYARVNKYVTTASLLLSLFTNALDITEKLCCRITQLSGALVGVNRGRDSLGYCWAVRKFLDGGMNALRIAFGLRSKVSQLTTGMVYTDLSLIQIRL